MENIGLGRAKGLRVGLPEREETKITQDKNMDHWRDVVLIGGYDRQWVWSIVLANTEHNIWQVSSVKKTALNAKQS